MSSKYPSEDLKNRVGDVPIHSHTRLLGVDIAVPQLKHRCQMYGEEYALAGSRGVEIEAVGSDRRITGRDRRYLAAWARRNLFDGVTPE